MKYKYKFATAGTLSGIKKSIKEFYCGEEKELAEIENGIYQISSKFGKILDNVFVIKEKGKFIFVSI